MSALPIDRPMPIPMNIPPTRIPASVISKSRGGIVIFILRSLYRHMHHHTQNQNQSLLNPPLHQNASF